MVVPVWGVLQAASILHFVFSDPRRSGVGCVLDTLTTRLSASPASGPGGILGAEPQPRQNGFGKIVVEVSSLFRRSTLLGLLAPAPVEFLGRACRVTGGCFSISPGCCEAASRWCGRGGGCPRPPEGGCPSQGPWEPASCHPVLLPAQRAQMTPWRLAVQTDIAWPLNTGTARCPTPRNPRNAGTSASASPEERPSRQKQGRKGEWVADPRGEPRHQDQAVGGGGCMGC